MARATRAGRRVYARVDVARQARGRLQVTGQGVTSRASHAACRAHEHSTQALRDGVSPHAGGLAQRAWPLLDMMRAAHEQGRHVTWGV
ncbi:DUF1840 family protein [Burkholderia contaminans]|uniref:DUF1840 family protein n=1 Tax=Burkholderia contaminans TaxID=488447 RepID=UPI003F68A311